MGGKKTQIDKISLGARPARQHRAHPEIAKPLLEVKALSMQGEGGFAVPDVSFTLRKLEKVAVTGETGAGKSTLLKLIAGLLQPAGGSLLYNGEQVLGPQDHLVPGHPGVAYLSQHFELQKSLRVGQVLAYANVLSDDEADRLYAVCQIQHLLGRRTDQLSGGEKQRVAICRLLISRPGLLLLDEPFSHLDMVHKNTLKSVIRDIGEKLDITCMLVSHDPYDTLPWADRIIVMRDGRIVQMDSPSVIYHRPVDEYAGGLFGKYNLLTQEDFRRFSRLPVIARSIRETGKGKIFVRPEQVRIVRKSERALRGRVKKVMFYGSFYEAEVLVGNKLLMVRTTVDELRPASVVYISVFGEVLQIH